MYNTAEGPRLKELIREKIERFDNEVYKDYARLFLEHSFYTPPEITGWLRDLIGQKSFKEIFQFNGNLEETL